MGHTNKPGAVENPRIIIHKYHDTHYEVLFEGSPLEARFADKTAEQAIENMIAWWERSIARAEKMIEDKTKFIAAAQRAIDQMNALKVIAIAQLVPTPN